MNDEVIAVKPIGLIRSEHTMAEQTPIQSVFAWGCVGTAEIFQEFDRIETSRNGWQDEVDEETACKIGRRGHARI